MNDCLIDTYKGLANYDTWKSCLHFQNGLEGRLWSWYDSDRFTEDSVTRLAILEKDKNFVKTPNWPNFWLFMSKSGNAGAEFPAISRNFSCFLHIYYMNFWCFHEKFWQSELPDKTIVYINFIISGIFTNFLANFELPYLVTLYSAKQLESDHFERLLEGIRVLVIVLQYPTFGSKHTDMKHSDLSIDLLNFFQADSK